MDTKRIFLMALFCFCLSPVYAYPITNNRQEFADPLNQQIETVNYCSLAKEPDKYKGKIIRIKVVLVESFVPGMVDGDDPFIYAPECGEKDFAAVLRWEHSSYAQSPALDALKRIENNRPSYFSRARVTLVGEFSGYSKHKFGHQGWADAEFIIHTVEKANPVPVNLPWLKQARHNKSINRTRN
ncbi:MAG: hypothetical protein QOJ02_219 [Acidobacteriota bacterium]|jgi:hypothetical protein|nr:hypothetical protein [Acidobacteriota bacterium]